MRSKPIQSVGDFMAMVKSDTSRSHIPRVFRPWYRGQADSTKPPTPSILRSPAARRHEFELASLFRLKAQAFGPTPETGRLDQWLILMQHHGVPTRLLDWTESPLAALFFAVSKFIGKRLPEIDSVPGLWVVNPFQLNRVSDKTLKRFPNTWTQSTTRGFKMLSAVARISVNPPKRDIRRVPPGSLGDTPSPARVASQKSCFYHTGTDDSDFEAIGKKTKLASDGFGS